MIAARDNRNVFTPEAYFAWEAQQRKKHELINGQVYAMNGGTQTHSTIAINGLLLIREHLRGSQCRVFNSDLKVNICQTANYTYPDLSVTCDDRDRDNALYITYPCLIVEVLSDSTEADDRGKKFDQYRRNPQLIDYVLVSSDEMAIDVYHKNEAADWVILSFRPGDQVELHSIGLTVPIENFYETVDFN